MQLDLSNPHHRREAMIRYFGVYGHRLSQHDITLDRGDYTDITAQLAAAKAQGKLGADQ